MTAASVWDDPSIAPAEGDYIKFDKPGDTVTGTITSIGTHSWGDGKVSPQLTLQTDAGTRTWTVGQVNAVRQLTSLRPAVGWTITATLTEIAPRPGGKSLKVFQIDAAAPGGSDTVAKAAAVLNQDTESEPPF